LIDHALDATTLAEVVPPKSVAAWMRDSLPQPYSFDK
jgi:hypothetical protein